MENNKDDRLIKTLIKGRDSAKRLHNHLHRKLPIDVSASIKDLLIQIQSSFSGGLSMLKSSDSTKICGDAGLMPSVDQLPEVCTGKKPPPAANSRRGCYKRRRTLDSRVKICNKIEDGYAWRKYGQKDIQNSKFPRCYFRCTHKNVHGCKALKQVDKLDHQSNMFHITYFDHHTCPSSNTLSHQQIVLDFEDSKNHHLFTNNPSTSTNIHIDPFVKQEVDSKTSSANVSDNITSNNDNQFSPTSSENEAVIDNSSLYQIEKRSSNSPNHAQKLDRNNAYFLFNDTSFMEFDHKDSYASTSSLDYLDLDFLNNGGLLSDILYDGGLFDKI